MGSGPHVAHAWWRLGVVEVRSHAYGANSPRLRAQTMNLIEPIRLYALRPFTLHGIAVDEHEFATCTAVSDAVAACLACRATLLDSAGFVALGLPDGPSVDAAGEVQSAVQGLRAAAPGAGRDKAARALTRLRKTLFTLSRQMALHALSAQGWKLLGCTGVGPSRNEVLTGATPKVNVIAQRAFHFNGAQVKPGELVRDMPAQHAIIALNSAALTIADVPRDLPRLQAFFSAGGLIHCLPASASMFGSVVRAPAVALTHA